MGSETKVVPTTSATQQSVQLPAYLQQAGQQATSLASNIATTPFQAYGGQLVAPLSGNQTAASSVTPGIAASEIDNQNTGLATGALDAAGGVAAADTGAGAPSGNEGAALAGLQGTQAASTANAGVPQANQASQLASSTTNAGMPSANLDAALAALSGVTSASNLNGVGGAPSVGTDLSNAAGYTAASAAPITASQIASYFNPYVQQALDPTAALDTRASAQANNAIDQKAAMSGAFGNSRNALEESQNNLNLQQTLNQLYGTGYETAFSSALSAAQAQQGAEATAANASTNQAGQLSTSQNTALQGIIDAANAAGAAGTTQSGLDTAAQQRLDNAATTSSGLATDAQNRLATASGSADNAATTQSGLATSDVNRLLSLVNPADANATTQSTLDNNALNQLLTTGNMDQTQQQNVDNANYQQFENQVLWPQQQLNALLAAAGGVPYGTTTTSNTQGTQVVQSPSVLGQILGAAGAGAGAFAASDVEAKEDIRAIEGEDVLAMLRDIPISTYRYKSEVRDVIGDDGRTRIGPMAQDWGKTFGGNGDAKIIPMPEIMGVLIGAVKALDERTANDDDALATIRRMAA